MVVQLLIAYAQSSGMYACCLPGTKPLVRLANHITTDSVGCKESAAHGGHNLVVT